MMTADHIRSVRATDTPEILRLIRALAEYEHMLHEVTITEADLREALFGPLPRIHGVLAEIDGEPVGLALFYYTFNTFKGRPNIFLEDLIVDPAYRGTGTGLALMRHLARLALAQKCGRIEWRVLNWNQLAIDFYQGIGAKPVEKWHTLLLGGDTLAALAEGISDG